MGPGRLRARLTSYAAALLTLLAGTTAATLTNAHALAPACTLVYT